MTFLLSFVLGALAALSMPGWGYIPLLFAGYSCFYVLILKTKSRMLSFIKGWLFGLGYFVIGLHWIANALLVDDNPYRWAYPIALVGLPALFSIYWGLAALLTRLLHQRTDISFFILFTFFFFTAEWSRSHLFTGFPWNIPGYAWAGILPMVQSIHYIGVYGLTGLTILMATLPGYLFISTYSKKIKSATAGCAILILCGLYGFGWHRLNTTNITLQNIDLVLVQANIPQKDKWNPDLYVSHFEKQISMSAPERPSSNYTIIVWPETAIPAPIFEQPEAFRRISAMLAQYSSGATLMSGVLRSQEHDGKASYYNSFATIQADQSVPALYDKTHLVPFGEYMPFQKWIPIRPIAEFPSFSGGLGPTTFSVAKIPPFTPLICYEIIFPGKVVPNQPSDRPDWIVNVTNDSWYGLTSGPQQHLAQAVFRAVEEGIPVVRSASTGISAVIDPLGRIHAKAELESEKTIRTQLPQPL